MNTSFDDFEVEHDFPAIGRSTMVLNARRLYRETDITQMILLAIEDTTERKQLRENMQFCIAETTRAQEEERKRIAREVWAYDAAKDAWAQLAAEAPDCHWASMENLPGTDEVVFVTATRYDHSRQTYRFRYDASVPTVPPKGEPTAESAPVIAM